MSLHAFWQNIPQQFIDEVQKSSQFHEYKRGDFVYRIGDVPAGMYLVEHGLVGIILSGANGKEHLLRFFKSGQFFGHRSLFASQNYHASTQVLEPSKIQFIPKKTIFELFTSAPHFYLNVVEQLAQELRQCEMQQVMLLDQQILPRVAQAVVYLKEIHPAYKWTRQELANFCASTTSTVIKALAELEDMGLIRQVGRSIEIVDRSGLIQLQFQNV